MKQASSIAKSVAQELRFMVVLSIGIMLIISIGLWAQSQGPSSISLTPSSKSRLSAQRQRLAQYPRKLSLVEQGLFIVGVEPVLSKAPWTITPADLTSSRVLYNVLTKPGFRWLGLQLILTLIGTGLALRGVKYLVFLPAKAYQKLNARLAGLPSDLNVATLYGTVHITARSGIIYISSTATSLVHEIEDFGLWLQFPQLRLAKSA